MSDPIILYDIPSKLPANAWSPNTWKARLALNIKGLAYKTVWVEYPDIEPLCKKIGAKPAEKTLSGAPLYTLPVIHDPAHGAVVSNSIDIAQYLDTTYPDTVPLLPRGSRALQHAFQEAHERVALASLYALTRPPTCVNLNPPSEEYYARTKTFVKPIPQGEARMEQWKKVREGHRVLSEWISKNEEGAFVMGKEISYADVTLCAWLLWAKIVCGPESEEWKGVLGWQDGWWARYLELFDNYLQVM